MDLWLENAGNIVRDIVRNYYCDGDPERIISYLSPGITWITCSEEYCICNKEHVCRKLIDDMENGHTDQFTLLRDEYRILSYTKESCTVLAFLIMEYNGKQGDEAYNAQRITMTLQKQEEELSVVLVHASIPHYTELEKENLQLKMAMEHSDVILFEYNITDDVIQLFKSISTISGDRIHRDLIQNYCGRAKYGNLIKEEDRPLFFDGFLTGKYKEVEVRLHLKKYAGMEYRWWKIKGNVISEGDRPVRVMGTMFNIDHLKRLESVTSRLEKIAAKIINDDFEHICIIDILTGSFKIYFPNKDSIYLLPDEGRYKDKIEKISQDIVYSKDKEKYKSWMNLDRVVQHLESGDAEYIVNYRITGQNGKICWNSAKFSYLDDNRDTVLLRMQDITEQYYRRIREKETKKLEEQKFLFLLSSMCRNFMEVEVGTGISRLTDPKAGVVAEGPFSDQIREFASSVVVPEERSSYMDKFDLANLMASIQENNNYYITYCTVKYEDGYHYLLINNTMFRGENDKEYIFLYAQDVTELKVKEEANRQTIMDALALAEQANLAKSNFLSRMSHEIRTPMNAIIGMTTIASVYMDNKEKVSDCISKINVSARFLLALINDILDMSRIESGKMLLSNRIFSLRDLIDDITAIILPQADEKGLDFQAEMDGITESYIGDPLRLNQVILNILSNAIKFTPEGGSVSFYISQTAMEEGYAVIQFRVRDTGVGMKTEFIEHLFEPFVQEDNSIATRYGGTGLGLAICKNLVGMMDGKIDVQSKEGAGSEFTVEVRLGLVENGDCRNAEEIGSAVDRSSDDELKEAGEEIPCDFSGCRILLVEDNELNTEIAKSILELRNFTVETAENGLIALEKFASSMEHYYSAILMDIRMPVMDGLTAAKRIRRLKNADSRTIPIIAMTANAFDEDVEKSKSSGMNAHLAKPIETEQLFGVLESLLIR